MKDDDDYTNVCDDLLAAGALTLVEEDFVGNVGHPATNHMAKHREELAEFIEAELYSDVNAAKSERARTSDENYSSGNPSTSRLSNQSWGSNNSVDGRSVASSQKLCDGGGETMRRSNSNRSLNSGSMMC